jgi:hypothetical protein
MAGCRLGNIVFVAADSGSRQRGFGFWAVGTHDWKSLPVEPAILCTVVIRVKLRPMFAIIFKVIIPSPFEMRRR